MQSPGRLPADAIIRVEAQLLNQSVSRSCGLGAHLMKGFNSDLADQGIVVIKGTDQLGDGRIRFFLTPEAKSVLRQRSTAGHAKPPIFGPQPVGDRGKGRLLRSRFDPTRSIAGQGRSGSSIAVKCLFHVRPPIAQISWTGHRSRVCEQVEDETLQLPWNSRMIVPVSAEPVNSRSSKTDRRPAVSSGRIESLAT